METPGSSPWVSVTGIAEHLGVAKETVYRWVESRGLPTHRMGRLMKFRICEVDDWVRRGGADQPIPSGRATPGVGGGRATSSIASTADFGNRGQKDMLHRYGKAIVRVENTRGKTTDSRFRGELQKLLAELMTVKMKLQIIPPAQLESISTLDDLEAMEEAVEAAASAESDPVREACLETAWNALMRITGQLAE